MITDIMTIVWKEWQELVHQRGSMRGSMRGGLYGLLVFIGVFGIFFPLQFGMEMISSPLQLLIWGWVPFLLITTVIADSFAGERERHTLETLLASRLSDQAILFGKITAAIGYGWGLTLVSLLLGLITTNIANWQGQIIIYPPRILLGILGISLLISLFASGLGVLISLRASTVRQAQQTFSIVFMLLFVPFFAIPYLPDSWKGRLLEVGMAASSNLTGVIFVAMLILLLIDIGLMAAASARFKRARLILD
jgi:ABC-2 type transport system permease protein